MFTITQITQHSASACSRCHFKSLRKSRQFDLSRWASPRSPREVWGSNCSKVPISCDGVGLFSTSSSTHKAAEQVRAVGREKRVLRDNQSGRNMLSGSFWVCCLQETCCFKCLLYPPPAADSSCLMEACKMWTPRAYISPRPLSDNSLRAPRKDTQA